MNKRFRGMKFPCSTATTLAFSVAFFLSSSSLVAFAAAKSHTWSVRWQPQRVVNGAPVFLEVTAPQRLQTLSGKWLGHQVFFSFNSPQNVWYGLAGVRLETAPGTYSLQLTGKTGEGAELSFQRPVVVGRAKYPSVAVTVERRFTEPSPEQLQTITRDKTIKEQVFAKSTAEQEWKGKFYPPVEARVSDVFGTRRTFNGKVQSSHQGLDYAVPAGTSVHALNAGTVLLAGPLYFEGNCVVLDHGQGLLTLYLHLSDFKVKAGERVASGQEIALSGGTGRSTGPHLHIAVRWQGIYLNPATLLTLRIP